MPNHIFFFKFQEFFNCSDSRQCHLSFSFMESGVCLEYDKTTCPGMPCNLTSCIQHPVIMPGLCMTLNCTSLPPIPEAKFDVGLFLAITLPVTVVLVCIGVLMYLFRRNEYVSMATEIILAPFYFVWGLLCVVFYILPSLLYALLRKYYR